jgi:hypothetical protein
MCCTTQKVILGKPTLNSIIALVCLLCFMTVLLLSVGILAVNTNHYHSGDCTESRTNHKRSYEGAEGICTLCTLTQNAKSLLKTFSAAFLSVPLVPVILFSAILLIFITTYFYWSPMELKIRINS